jgi:hypothetical protein
MLFPVRVKVALAGLMVAGGAAATALVGPAGPAVGQSSQPVEATLQLNSPGTLVAKGAAVQVPVTASCSGPAGVTGSVFVQLTERVGAETAVGGGGATIACTGTSQTAQVLVTAQISGVGPAAPSSKAFKRGTAIANASISACTVDFQFCANQALEPTIAIN